MIGVGLSRINAVVVLEVVILVLVDMVVVELVVIMPVAVVVSATEVAVELGFVLSRVLELIPGEHALSFNI